MQHPREPPFDEQVNWPEFAPCECELRGPFCSGVPGILAAVVDDQVVPNTSVERCDICQRYPSDEAARERLRDWGVLPADVDRGPTHTVHCYVLVRVSLPPRPAANSQEAARIAREQFNWKTVNPAAIEIVEFVEFLVDVEGDEEHLQTKRFAADLTQLP